MAQTAASSALGRQVIELAVHTGVRTINVVRRNKYKDDLKKLG